MTILAIFLIMVTVGVLLRVPALRQTLGIARANKRGIYLALLIAAVSFIPPIAHVIWQWQGAIYDNEEAIIAKDILLVSSPLSTIICIGLIIWVFTVPAIKK